MLGVYKTLLTHMPLVANMANTKMMQKDLNKMTETLKYGYSSEGSTLGESYPMNTYMTGFRRFSKIFVCLCFV